MIDGLYSARLTGYGKWTVCEAKESRDTIDGPYSAWLTGYGKWTVCEAKETREMIDGPYSASTYWVW